ncbi:MAG TPA: L,D-transpeptidase [Terriglobales bacterium]|nr:L,D-transpeptidase [Terriglobales bacterium]
MRRLIGNSNLEATAILILALILMSLAANAQNPVEGVRSARKVVVSLEDRKLALLEDGVVKKIYPVAVGKNSTPSPTGTFQVVVRITDPTYYHPHVVIPAGPASPIGTRWIGLNQKGYGIHGTNEPRSIGKAALHGCIRMAKHDLEELFTLVQVGDEVEIRGERDQETTRWFGTPAVVMAKADVPQTTAMVGGGAQQ